MKRVFIAAAAAALIASSCGSRGNTSAGTMAAESESTPLLAANGHTPGDLQTYIYEGILPGADVPGVKYRLVLQEMERDSLATYTLTTTYQDAEDGQDRTFSDSGTVTTLIGIPDDSTAIAYRLVSAGPGHATIHFLAEGDSALTMVGDDFTRAVSGLNYTLKKER